MPSLDRRLRTLAMASALIVLAGCTGDGSPPTPASTPSPGVDRQEDLSEEEHAAALLDGALTSLATAPGTRIDARSSPGVTAPQVYVRTAAGGVTYGTIRNGATRLTVLGLDDATYVKADGTFWHQEAAEAADPLSRAEKLRLLTSRWVRVDELPEVVQPNSLRPAALAERLREQVERSGVSEVERGTYLGTEVNVITVGTSQFYVTVDPPHRLLRIDHPGLDRPGRVTRGTLRTETGTEDESIPGIGDGMDLLELGERDLDDLYDDIEDIVEDELPKALDVRPKFRMQASGQMACPGGNCVWNVRVTSAATGKASGRVTAELRGSISGPTGSRPCADVATMSPNGSASMRCAASFVLPPCQKGRCSYTFQGHGFIIGRAALEVRGEQLARKRENDREDARCRLSDGFDAGAPAGGGGRGFGALRPRDPIPKRSECLLKTGNRNPAPGGANRQIIPDRKHPSRPNTSWRLDCESAGPNKPASFHIQVKKGNKTVEKYHFWRAEGRFIDVDRIPELVEPDRAITSQIFREHLDECYEWLGVLPKNRRGLSKLPRRK